MTTIITNIKCLVSTRTESFVLRGKDLTSLPFINNAYLIIEDGLIADFGEMDDLLFHVRNFSETYDATDQFVLPAWCDSHTHLVFTGTCEDEFADKIKGLSDAEIAEKGGGILNYSKKINAVSEDELFKVSLKRLEEVVLLGTGAIEIKSGYGLTVEGELKMLRVIKRLQQSSNLSIKATFSAAYAIPGEFEEDHAAYLDHVIYQILPAIAKENLADFIEVFGNNSFLNKEETKKILKAGMDQGLKPKFHAEQLSVFARLQPGAVLTGPVQIPHEEFIKTLSASDGIATLLPTEAFFLAIPFPPARQLIDNNCAIALATGYNPASSPSGNMNLVVSLSCIQMKMLPEEVINAATLNGAYAMDLGDELGSITVGKKANLIFTKPIPSLAFLPYSFGNNLIDKVMIKGEWFTNIKT